METWVVPGDLIHDPSCLMIWVLKAFILEERNLVQKV
jgi:hypothetical protein